MRGRISEKRLDGDFECTGADAELWSHALLAVLEHLGRLVLAEPERFGAERVTGAVRAMLAGWAA